MKHIKGVDINYIEYGEGTDIVLLHGWGQNIEMMKPVGDKLKGHIIISNTRINVIIFFIANLLI